MMMKRLKRRANLGRRRAQTRICGLKAFKHLAERNMIAELAPEAEAAGVALCVVVFRIPALWWGQPPQANF